MSGALFALQGHCVLSGDKGWRPFLCTPFSACDVLPSLRSGQIALDEAERFPAQSICQRLGVMGNGRFCPVWEPLISTDPKVSWRNSVSH